MDVTALRSDGRRAHEVRRLECAFGVIEGCDGSALLTQGLTKVIASVYGPREASLRQIAKHDRAIVRCQVSQAAFSTVERRRRFAGDKRSSYLENFVEETFSNVIQTNLFRKSQIDITIHILQADGGLLPACINATCLALTHAGIPMLDFVTCCSVGYVDSSLVLDLNHAEESSGGPRVVLTLMPRTSEILTLKMESTSARVNTSLLEDMMKEVQVGCHQINKMLDSKVREHISISLVNHQSLE